MKIDPKKQFVPNQKNLAELAAKYGLKLKDFYIATTGIENTTIIANCDEGRFVFRVYRQSKKSDGHIKQEIKFTIFLKAHDIQVPQIIVNIDGDSLTVFTANDVSWQVIVMEFVEGVHPAKYSHSLIERMATLQATIHNISSDFSDSYLGFVLQKLREQHFIKDIPTAELQDTKLVEFLDRAKKYMVTLSDDLPWGLCHLDFDKGNILVDEKDEITVILDFDDLALAPYVVDLGYSLWSVWYSGEVESASEYLLAYEKSRKLSGQEKDCLQSVILFRHYIICAVNILEGETDDEHVDKYLRLENEMRTHSLK